MVCMQSKRRRAPRKGLKRHIKVSKLFVLSAVLLALVVSIIAYNVSFQGSSAHVAVKAAFFQSAVRDVSTKLQPISRVETSSSAAAQIAKAYSAQLPGASLSQSFALTPALYQVLPLVAIAIALILSFGLVGSLGIAGTAMAPLITSMEGDMAEKDGSEKKSSENPQINQILLMGVTRHVIEPLKDIVKWDRYGFREYDGFIFGWIKRDDGQLDFVVVRFWIDWKSGGTFYTTYDTSSKKYSREIGNRLGSPISTYSECRPASDIVPDEYLIKWQKVANNKL